VRRFILKRRTIKTVKLTIQGVRVHTSLAHAVTRSAVYTLCCYTTCPAVI